MTKTPFYQGEALEFKVGDRVRFTGSTSPDFWVVGGLRVGDIGRVVDLGGAYGYCVEFADNPITYVITPDEIEAAPVTLDAPDAAEEARA